MSAHSYDDILQRARKELSDAELRRLADDLRTPLPQKNEDADMSNGETASVYDSMSRRGLIGKLTTAPADLSTNPNYMEGFGKDAE